VVVEEEGEWNKICHKENSHVNDLQFFGNILKTIDLLSFETENRCFALKDEEDAPLSVSEHTLDSLISRIP
jgi:hypothetical protein